VSGGGTDSAYDGGAASAGNCEASVGVPEPKPQRHSPWEADMEVMMCWVLGFFSEVFGFQVRKLGCWWCRTELGSRRFSFFLVKGSRLVVLSPGQQLIRKLETHSLLLLLGIAV
jgi:hypothetical protein